MRPDPFSLASLTLPEPPRALKAFVTKLLVQEYEGPQRRALRRLPAVVPVVAIPLDPGFVPRGEPFAAMTADLSTAGLRLFSTRAASSELLAVELKPATGPHIQVVLQVLRCHAVGRFYEIAGQLVARTEGRPV